jgi:hypothetical protein
MRVATLHKHMSAQSLNTISLEPSRRHEVLNAAHLHAIADAVMDGLNGLRSHDGDQLNIEKLTILARLQAMILVKMEPDPAERGEAVAAVGELLKAEVRWLSEKLESRRHG